MTDDRFDSQLSDALAQLRRTTDIPTAEPDRERALLAAFDAHWARPRRSFRRVAWVWTAAAASMAMAFGVGRFVVMDTPAWPTTTIATDRPPDMTGFVAWPGAHALPPLERGELLRIDLPREALPALGLFAPLSTASVVPADIVIGQDGLARAVRLVQQ